MARRYKADAVAGNVHNAVSYMNKFVLKYHPDARLVTAEFNGGGYTLLVYEYDDPQEAD